jgi:zinc/manganese transport system substrate-binding protein
MVFIMERGISEMHDASKEATLVFHSALFPRSLFFALLLAGVVACSGPPAPTSSPAADPLAAAVKVVAAENFYGDVIKQLGGVHVQVTSILSDPNVDPHEYESNVQDSIAVSQANLVVENGLDYDSWMDKLLSASPNANRVVLVAGRIAPHPLPDNPHVWYGIDNMPAIARSIADALTKIDPQDGAEFSKYLAAFNASLSAIDQKLAGLNKKYAKTPVGLTETIFLYQTQPIGLNVLTPFEFEKAIAEGNDPPANTVAIVSDQVNKKQIKVLIYNNQTITPITTNLQNAAKKLNIPNVSVSETLPAGKSYQTWMLDQLNSLDQSLQSAP